MNVVTIGFREGKLLIGEETQDAETIMKSLQRGFHKNQLSRFFYRRNTLRDFMQNPFLCRQILSLAVKQFEETGSVLLTFRNTAVLMVEVLMSNIKFNSKHQVTDFTKMGKDEEEQMKMKVELKKVFEACFQCITDQDGDFSFHGHLRVSKIINAWSIRQH